MPFPYPSPYSGEGSASERRRGRVRARPRGASRRRGGGATPLRAAESTSCTSTCACTTTPLRAGLGGRRLPRRSHGSSHGSSERCHPWAMASAGKAARGVGGWVGWLGLVEREAVDERPGGRVICSESGLHARSAASRLHPPPTVGAPSGRPRPHGMAAWDGGMGRGSTAWAGAPPSALGSGTGRVAKRERETSRRRVVGGLMRPQPHHKTTTCVEITTCMLCTCLWGRYIVEVCRVSDINIR